MAQRGKKRRRADGSIASGKAPPRQEAGYFRLNRSKIEEEFGEEPDFKALIEQAENRETH